MGLGNRSVGRKNIKYYDNRTDFPIKGKVNILYISGANDGLYYWFDDTEYVRVNDVVFLNQIGVDELKPELKKADINLGDVSGIVNINWSLGIQYQINLTADTTLTFSNILQGKGIMLIVSGNAAFSLTMPSGVDVLSLADFTTESAQENKIYIYCNDATTPDYTTTLIVKL